MRLWYAYFRSALMVFIATALLAAAPLAAKPLKILTDIRPIQALVSEVTGGVVLPDMLLTSGVDGHDFALKPSDLRKVQSADLVIWAGPDAVPGLAKILARPEISVKSLRLDTVTGTLHLPLRHSGVFREADAAMAEFDDPHRWLSPKNARLWIAAIVKRLAALDPENAPVFRANAAGLDMAIEIAEAQISAALDPHKSRRFVQFHDALQYFEIGFGLRPIGFVTVGDADAASLGSIAELREALIKHQPACVFVAPGAQAKRALPLLEGTNARLGFVDPLGTTDAQNPQSYVQLLLDISKGYVECFDAL